MTRQEKLFLGTDYIVQGLRLLQEAVTGDYQHEETTALVQVLSQMELVQFNMKRCWDDWVEFVEYAGDRKNTQGRNGGRMREGKMTSEEAVVHACITMALVYESMGDYSYPTDGFCKRCPFHNDKEAFKNNGKILTYVRQAAVQRLIRDGYSIAPGFDPITGEEDTRDTTR